MDASVRTSRFSMAKQPGGLINPANMLAGVSSFAFQGTNCHLIVGAASHTIDQAAVVPNWQSQFINVLPPAHAMVMAFTSGPARAAVFAMQLDHAAHAYLRDHQVSEKIIFPGKSVGLLVFATLETGA